MTFRNGTCRADQENPCSVWKLLMSAINLLYTIWNLAENASRQGSAGAETCLDSILSSIEAFLREIGLKKPESTPRELSVEEQLELNGLLARKEAIESEREDFDRKENTAIKKLEGELDQETYGELKKERSQKRRQDQQFRQEEQELESQMGEILETPPEADQQAVSQAISNTLKNEERKNDRNSATSNTPPGLQDPWLVNPAKEEPAKRGAPQEHSGYQMQVSGLEGIDFNNLTEEDLRRLSETEGVQIVMLTPDDVPEGAEMRTCSARVAFGMVKMPVLLLYIQKEAVWKDPQNRKRLIKKKARYPDWLKKSWSYCPDYRTEALYLRLQGHMSYSALERYFREYYGVPLTGPTIWHWFREAAAYAEKAGEGIKKALAESDRLNLDESGIKDGGALKWVFTCVNENWTWMTVSEHRDFEGFVDNGVVLDAADGTIIIHDGYNAYGDGRLSRLLSGRCWAHKIREAKSILQFEQRNIENVLEISAWFETAMEERTAAMAEGKNSLGEERIRELVSLYDSIISRALKDIEKTKTVFQRQTKARVIRKVAKDILKKRDSLLDFLDGEPPLAPAPWAGYGLSGRKNPQAVVKLAGIANEIDKAAAVADREGRPVPRDEAEELKKAFFGQAEKVLEEFKDKRTQLHCRTDPVLKEITTDVSKFFKDLEKDRDAFLLFIKDFRADPTNNWAERSIRPLKVAMKIIGSFRGYSSGHVSLESYMSSAKKQHHNLFDALEALVEGDSEFLFRDEKKDSEESQSTKTDSLNQESNRIIIQTVPTVNTERRRKKREKSKSHGKSEKQS